MGVGTLWTNGPLAQQVLDLNMYSAGGKPGHAQALGGPASTLLHVSMARRDS
ncbi:hypothetical protein PGT21_033027 [Puccinia graminis f. sp. tritici]|uniref:Uncharacterized protein n=1 Tax=Puccinia graminis f. sp. tritici TaxID=56615 RepID=A0A5B0QXZ1_PUCGR|nr:hypothetical protein PGT21_033027 [Puccinia graminis f. sp. tritici]